jgi:hypothetical protein
LLFLSKRQQGSSQEDIEWMIDKILRTALAPMRSVSFFGNALREAARPPHEGRAERRDYVLFIAFAMMANLE